MLGDFSLDFSRVSASFAKALCGDCQGVFQRSCQECYSIVLDMCERCLSCKSKVCSMYLPELFNSSGNANLCLSCFLCKVHERMDVSSILLQDVTNQTKLLCSQSQSLVINPLLENLQESLIGECQTCLLTAVQQPGCKSNCSSKFSLFLSSTIFEIRQQYESLQSSLRNVKLLNREINLAGVFLILFSS